LLWSFGPTGPLLVRNQVVTMHDAAVYRVAESYGRLFRAWYSCSMPLLARRIAHTMTVSEFSRRELHATLGLSPARCTVSGEGHEHALRVPADASILARHALEPGRYVLAVSSIAPHKNFGLLVDALRLLGDVDFQIVIAGTANARIFGDLAAHLDRIKLLGYVSDGELRALYEHAGLFVFPSRYEGFGLPPLEAMVHACPVLAARAGALPEVCGEGARYFSPDDPRELAALISELMLDPDQRAALVTRGNRELQRHRWSSAAGAHLAVARQLLAAAHP
jgi:glycosyltransferase involved in cell wall biosynthesis